MPFECDLCGKEIKGEPIRLQWGFITYYFCCQKHKKAWLDVKALPLRGFGDFTP